MEAKLTATVTIIAVKKDLVTLCLNGEHHKLRVGDALRLDFAVETTGSA